MGWRTQRGRIFLRASTSTVYEGCPHVSMNIVSNSDETGVHRATPSRRGRDTWDDMQILRHSERARHSAELRIDLTFKDTTRKS